LLREFVGGSDDTTAEVAARLPSVIASLGLDPDSIRRLFSPI
jgi:hypothetical protein